MSAFLTDEEVARLTGRTRFRAQCRALDAARIPYRRDADGRPIVRQSAVDERRGPARNHEPRWDLIET